MRQSFTNLSLFLSEEPSVDGANILFIYANKAGTPEFFDLLENTNSATTFCPILISLGC